MIQDNNDIYFSALFNKHIQFQLEFAPVLMGVLNNRQQVEEDFPQFLRKNGYNRKLYQCSLNPYKMNQGFSIIRNTENTVKWFNKSLEIYDLINFKYNNEQTVIEHQIFGFIASSNDLINRVKLLLITTQGFMIQGHDSTYNEDKTFIMHNYGDGFPYQTRYNIITEIVENNKWWKQIYG